MMKTIKWLLITLVGALVLLALVGLTLSPKFKVNRTVLVSAPVEKIYPLISQPRQWPNWSVWNRRDPVMQIEYSGPESGVGATWAWKSKSEGDGRMRFSAAVPDQRVDFELFFPDFDSTSLGQIQLSPQGNATQVSWTMNGDMGGNPLMRWMALFMDRMVGPDFEAGLANLKVLAEKS